MQRNRHSRTAESVAAYRAGHLLDGGSVVFEDAFALHLTSSRLRHIVTNPLLRRAMKAILGDFGLVNGQVLARARFAEDLLLEAVESEGVDQYVIVSAGFDSFSLRRRDLAERLSIFEIDHPASQRLKRERLTERGFELPKNLSFVPADLEETSVAEALAATSYARERPAFFSWLGAMTYLSEEAIFRTITSIASVSQLGSQLVFDFDAPAEYASAKDGRILRKMMRYTARRDEPLITFFAPDVLLARLFDLGFESRELLTPEEQDARYFADRTDGLRTMPASFLVHLRRRA